MKRVLRMSHRTVQAARKRSELFESGDLLGAFANQRASRRTPLTNEWREKVQDFFKSEEISRVVPHLKGGILVKNGVRVTKNAKNCRDPSCELRSLQFMTTTLSSGYQKLKAYSLK